MAASEDRARRRQERRAGGANEPRAHERGRSEEEPRAARPDAAPAPVVEDKRGGFLQFASESWAELKKVEWPTQAQLIQGVVVVLIACLIVGVYLYGADLVFKRVVQDVFLR